MSRVCLHVFAGDAEALSRCAHCGTTKAGAVRGLGCIWRDVPDTRFGALAPEPALRIPACEDAETISSRIAELAKERDAVLSAPEPLTMVDIGDCCL